MPRPSPEYLSYTVPGTFQDTGGPLVPVNLSASDARARLFDREYTSGKTTGYPDVKPLPFLGHKVALRTRPKVSVIQAKAYLNRYNWYEYKAAAGAIGVPFHGPVETKLGNLAFVSNAEKLARSRVISNIQRLKVNVAQNVAEYRQVHRMFGTNVKRITDAYRALRRGDVSGYTRAIPLRKRHEQSLLRRGPMDIRSSAPSIWLESQYGWLPLLGDIHTGITNFYYRVEEGYRMRSVGTGRAVEVTPQYLYSTNGIVRTYETQYTKHRVKYIIEYEIDSSRLANMQSWGLTNPALLAWELLPYSFVVDWFYPVGDWLSQVGYQLGLYFYRGMRSGITNRAYSRVYKPIPDSGGWKYTVKGSDLADDTYWKREVLLSFPNPGKPVVDSDGLRGKRIANALALLAVAFDRKR